MEAGLGGNFKNHSLRSTGVTVLYDADIPEAVIQKHIGHKSLDVLRSYERTTMTQNLEVSNLLHHATAVSHSEDDQYILTDQLGQFEHPEDSDFLQ